jgi:hypothetical protein
VGDPGGSLTSVAFLVYGKLFWNQLVKPTGTFLIINALFITTMVFGSLAVLQGVIGIEASLKRRNSR